MSAAFCGVEVLARECRGGETDKWNNMMGACSAGCVGNLGKGPGDPPSLHPPCALSPTSLLLLCGCGTTVAS